MRALEKHTLLTMAPQGAIADCRLLCGGGGDIRNLAWMRCSVQCRSTTLWQYTWTTCQWSNNERTAAAQSTTQVSHSARGQAVMHTAISCLLNTSQATADNAAAHTICVSNEQ